MFIDRIFRQFPITIASIVPRLWKPQCRVRRRPPKSGVQRSAHANRLQTKIIALVILINKRGTSEIDLHALWRLHKFYKILIHTTFLGIGLRHRQVLTLRRQILQSCFVSFWGSPFQIVVGLCLCYISNVLARCGSTEISVTFIDIIFILIVVDDHSRALKQIQLLQQGSKFKYFEIIYFKLEEKAISSNPISYMSRQCI